MTPKTFKIKSFGCQMNVYDGERMAELLGQRGMTAAAEGDDADLVALLDVHSVLPVRLVRSHEVRAPPARAR